MEKDMKKVKTVLKLDDFSLSTSIGVGASGKVKLAYRKKDGQIMCVKIMKKSVIIQSKWSNHIINQVEILSQVKHPMIVDFEGIYQDAKYLHLFMEYVPGGQLFTHLREKGVFEPSKASFYAAQVVLIFQYLHSKEIIYRDLKPENILIAKDGYIKLTDFGFSKKIVGRTYTRCGTPQYLAPEVLLNQGHGKPVDWWTLGIFLFQMLAGIDPFTDNDPMSVYRNIVKGKIKFPKDFDHDAKSLVKHLVISDLSKRFGNLKNGVDDIKNHRYFVGVCFKDLQKKYLIAPFIPIVKSDDDTANFCKMDDSNSQAVPTPSSSDPFLQWS